MAHADRATLDFSLASNPNGHWSYGATPSLGGAFSSFTVSNADVSGWFDQWTTSSGHPAAGIYDIQGLFEGLDYAYPTPTDVHILLDSSTSLFSTEISPFEVPSSFSLCQSPNAGDTIDFVVGFGTDGSYLGDTTGLVATIRAVPERSTWLLLGAGILGLIGASRRRIRSAPQPAA